MAGFNDLRLRQLDEALQRFRPLRDRPVPEQGWTRTVREALGMTLQQLADRAGVSKTAARSAELNEARGKVQMDSLRNLARAMDCDLVYALVPRTSLRESIKHQAEKIASGLVNRVAESMDLEEQGVAKTETRTQKEEIKDQLIRQRTPDFWDV